MPLPLGQDAYMQPRTIRDVLADNLRARLRGAGFDNPTALARKAGVDPSYMSKLMRSQFSCSVDLLDKFATALRCQPWELLVDSEASREEGWRRVMNTP